MTKAGSTEQDRRRRWFGRFGGTPAGGFRPKRRFGSCWRGSAGKRASRRSAAAKGQRRKHTGIPCFKCVLGVRDEQHRDKELVRSPLLGNYWTEVWRLIPDPDDIPIEGCSRAGNTVPVNKVDEVDEVLHWI